MPHAHTPAPWTVEEDDGGLFVRTPYASNHDEAIMVYCAPADGAREQREADAYLIAAAPDLLYAAESAVDLDLECGDPMCSDDAPCVGRLLRNAIAKARTEVRS